MMKKIFQMKPGNLLVGLFAPLFFLMAGGIATGADVPHEGSTYPLTSDVEPSFSDQLPSHTQMPAYKWFNNVLAEKGTPPVNAPMVRDPKATYPLTNIFLPDCSLYIDPKDAEMYSHCEKVNTSYNIKWHGYFEIMGKPGTSRSLGQTDLFFPLVQDDKNMTFINVRGQVDFGSDNSEYNLGVGHRHMFKEWILGAYGYYDQRQTDTGTKFNQVTFGVEALSETWDFRANGYIPETKTELLTNKVGISIIRPGDQIKARIAGLFEETALPGLDMEIGYRLPLSSKILPDKLQGLFEDVRLYAGGYHFIGRGFSESVSGPRARLEARVHDLPMLGTGSRLMLGIEAQYDSPRGQQTTGMVSLRVPFGVGSMRKRPGLKGLDRRMMEPVVRDVDVVVPKGVVPVEIVPVFGANGKEITMALDLEPGKGAWELQAILDSESVQNEVALVVVGGTLDLSTGLSIKENQIIASAAKEMLFTYTSSRLGAGSIGHTVEGDPVKTSGCTDLQLGDSAQINGWEINAAGCDYGIDLDSGNDFFLTNSIVHGATEANVRISKGSLHVDGVTLYGTDIGVLITETGRLKGVEGTDGTLGYSADYTPGDEERKSALVTFDSNVVRSTSYEEAQVSGVLLDATGYGNGVRATDIAGNYFITDLHVKNAMGDGVQAIGEKVILDMRDIRITASAKGLYVKSGATVTIIDGFVGGHNGHGMDANNGGQIYATNVDFLNNDHDGIDSNGGGSYIEMTGGTISGSGAGVLVNAKDSEEFPNKIVLNNVTITGNGTGIANYGGIVEMTGGSIIDNRNNGVSAISHNGVVVPYRNYKGLQIGYVDGPSLTTLTGVRVSGNGGSAFRSEGGTITATGEISGRIEYQDRLNGSGRTSSCLQPGSFINVNGEDVEARKLTTAEEALVHLCELDVSERPELGAD